MAKGVLKCENKQPTNQPKTNIKKQTNKQTSKTNKQPKTDKQLKIHTNIIQVGPNKNIWSHKK